FRRVLFRSLLQLGPRGGGWQQKCRERDRQDHGAGEETCVLRDGALRLLRMTSACDGITKERHPEEPATRASRTTHGVNPGPLDRDIRTLRRGWPRAAAPRRPWRWLRRSDPARRQSAARVVPAPGGRAPARPWGRRPAPPSGDENRGGAPGRAPGSRRATPGYRDEPDCGR